MWTCARWTLEEHVYDMKNHEPGGSVLGLVEEDIVDFDWLIWMMGSS